MISILLSIYEVYWLSSFIGIANWTGRSFEIVYVCSIKVKLCFIQSKELYETPY